MKSLILVILCILILTCSANDSDESNKDQSIYNKNTLNDYELFTLANNFIDTNNLDLALIELDKLEVLFPNSVYAKKSILVTAYIHFLKKDYEKTRALAESFKNYYPGNQNIIYANYLEAMTYYVAIKKSNFSQENSLLALEKFNFILNAYPNSKYEIDIIIKIKLIKNNLASANLDIAKFYLDKGNNNGALVYLNEIFKNYSSSLSIEETLFLLTKIYYEIEEYELSKKYASILAYNFPDSVWYEKSYNVINNLVDINANEKWYEKLNPIKIFIQDLEKKSDYKLIQSIE